MRREARAIKVGNGPRADLIQQRPHVLVIDVAVHIEQAAEKLLKRIRAARAGRARRRRRRRGRHARRGADGRRVRRAPAPAFAASAPPAIASRAAAPRPSGSPAADRHQARRTSHSLPQAGRPWRESRHCPWREPRAPSPAATGQKPSRCWRCTIRPSDSPAHRAPPPSAIYPFRSSRHRTPKAGTPSPHRAGRPQQGGDF